MRFGTFIVTLILMAGIFAGMMQFWVGLANEYSVTLDTQELNDTFEKTNELLNTTDELEGELLEGDFSATSGITVAAEGVFSAPKIAFQSVGVFLSMVNDAAQILQLPEWVISTFIAVVIVLLIMAVAFWYQGRDM